MCSLNYHDEELNCGSLGGPSPQGTPLDKQSATPLRPTSPTPIILNSIQLANVEHLFYAKQTVGVFLTIFES